MSRSRKKRRVEESGRKNPGLMGIAAAMETFMVRGELWERKTIKKRQKNCREHKKGRGRGRENVIETANKPQKRAGDFSRVKKEEPHGRAWRKKGVKWRQSWKQMSRSIFFIARGEFRKGDSRGRMQRLDTGRKKKPRQKNYASALGHTNFLSLKSKSPVGQELRT